MNLVFVNWRDIQRVQRLAISTATAYLTLYWARKTASSIALTIHAVVAKLASKGGANREMRIPVAMSNVADAADCRPHCWGLFGADDPIGADYRACANYGPLY